MAEIGTPKAREREGSAPEGGASPRVTSQNNPLLQLGFDIPFDALLPEHVEPAVAELLARSRRNIEAIENDPAPPTYDNTLERLDTASEELEVVMTVVGHWETVMTSAELREVYNRVRPEVSAFYAGIPLRPLLWQRLKAYGASAEAATLTGARARFLKKTLEQFRREGADLEPRDKQRLEAISRELSELTSKFGQNVVASTAAFELVIDDEAKLAGLPEAAKERAREDANARGLSGYRFSLQGPSMIPILTYAASADLRRQVAMASESRATSGEHQNPPLIQRVLELRNEQAKLLGFSDFADLVLADRMARRAAPRASSSMIWPSAAVPPSSAKNASCWRSAGGSRGQTPPSSSAGTRATTPRSSARRSTISTRRSCVPISRSTRSCRACSRRRSACTACPCARTRRCGAGTRTCVPTTSSTSRVSRWRRFMPISSRARASATAPG